LPPPQGRIRRLTAWLLVCIFPICLQYYPLANENEIAEPYSSQHGLTSRPLFISSISNQKLCCARPLLYTFPHHFLEHYHPLLFLSLSTCILPAFLLFCNHRLPFSHVNRNPYEVDAFLANGLHFGYSVEQRVLNYYVCIIEQ